MKKLGIVLLVVLIGLTLFWLWPNASPKQTTTNTLLSAKPTGGDFTLTSAKGPVSLSDFKDKLVLIYFGYTFCPDVCPTNLGSLAMGYQKLTDAEKDKLQVLFISVDPNRDTPERLQQYSDYFATNMIGLTGKKETLDDIVKRYGAVYKIHQPEPNNPYYPVDHSAFTYVVDQDGKLVDQLPHGTTAVEFVESIRLHLKDETSS